MNNGVSVPLYTLVLLSSKRDVYSVHFGDGIYIVTRAGFR